MKAQLHRLFALLTGLAVLFPIPGAVSAQTSVLQAGWQEVGTGSATGGGVSANGGTSQWPALAVDGSGIPYTVWHDSSSGNWEIYVRRWNGVSWEEVGAGSATGGGISSNAGISQWPSIAIAPDDVPYVAWFDNTSGNDEIYLRRWNGSAWVEVGAGSATGGGISNDSTRSQRPSVAIAPDGVPFVAWWDWGGPDWEVYLRRWNGSAWVEVGAGSATGGGISDNGGRSHTPSLAIASDGVPYVAWQDDTSGDYEIYVRRWTGSTWAEVGTGSATGGGVSNNTTPSYKASLALDSAGAPWVTWHDEISGQAEIYVRRWDGSSWAEVGPGSASGGGISNSAGYSRQATLALHPDFGPFVAWADTSAGDEEIYVRNWNGSSWMEVDTGSASGGGISNNQGESQWPWLGVAPDGTAFVAWYDNSGVDDEIYVRQRPPAKPAAPTLNPISNPDGNGDYLVDWSDVIGATSFILDEDDNASFSSPTTRYSGPNSQYSVTAQPAGTWYYRVRASNTAGDSAWSNVESVVVNPPPPGAPTLNPIDNADGDGDYLIDWEAVMGAASYTLEEDDGPSFPSPTVRYSGADSQHSISGQMPGTWYYRVKSSNAGGDSPWSAFESVVVQATGSGDGYEVDDSCAAANNIALDGSIQTHTFHDDGDEDWVTFPAEKDKTYVIRVDNVGDKVDAVIMLYNQCEQAPLTSEHNAFGPSVRLEWDAPATGQYFLRLIQNDQSLFGEDTNYNLSIEVDTEPPSPPPSLRAAGADRTLVVQWRRSPERDVTRYRVWWGQTSGGPYSGVEEVAGGDTTYYNITGLTNGVLYYVRLQAVDSSGNVSDYSLEIAAQPSPSADTSQPVLSIAQPTAGTVYTTTKSILTLGGTVTDSGNNLSRVRVRNGANSSEGWDYGLSGASGTFSVEGIQLAEGDNAIQVTAFDTADNSGSGSLTVRRLSGMSGVVLIAGGRNNSRSLQTNIDYVTNRAYRVFQGAGIPRDNIYYLSPGPQDADGDGTNDVRAATTPASVQAALQWAAGRLSANTPFYLYLMDHGVVEAFCADGCSSGGRIESDELDAWLDDMEASSGATDVNVIYEACHSGSFVDRVDSLAKSLSKSGRVIIASTGRTNNAYASAQGAYFSDAFFSAIAESHSLLASFGQAKTAVAATGTDQTPWLDDNGDGLYNPADGDNAKDRYVARQFGSLLPEIVTAAVDLQGAQGLIAATVEVGDEPLRSVWAAVYPPSFQEPGYTTLDLGIPLIELAPEAGQTARPGEAVQYAVDYNGFIEAGIYRVVIYGEDQVGNQALPRQADMGEHLLYLPLLVR